MSAGKFSVYQNYPALALVLLRYFNPVEYLVPDRTVPTSLQFLVCSCWLAKVAEKRDRVARRRPPTKVRMVRI